MSVISLVYVQKRSSQAKTDGRHFFRAISDIKSVQISKNIVAINIYLISSSDKNRTFTGHPSDKIGKPAAASVRNLPYPSSSSSTIW